MKTTPTRKQHDQDSLADPTPTAKAAASAASIANSNSHRVSQCGTEAFPYRSSCRYPAILLDFDPAQHSLAELTELVRIEGERFLELGSSIFGVHLLPRMSEKIEEYLATLDLDLLDNDTAAQLWAELERLWAILEHYKNETGPFAPAPIVRQEKYWRGFGHLQEL